MGVDIRHAIGTDRKAVGVFTACERVREKDMLRVLVIVIGSDGNGAGRVGDGTLDGQPIKKATYTIISLMKTL